MLSPRWQRLDGLALDLRHAARVVVGSPAFALASILTLGLGIGANSAVFSMVNAILLRPLPLGDKGERIVTLHSTHPSQPEPSVDSGMSYLDLADVRRDSRTLEDVAGYAGRDFTLAAGGEAERLRGGSVTPNLFPLLGIHPSLGRQFRDDEAQPPGMEPVVMLSDRLWQQRFGGDPTIVGQIVMLNGRPLTVVAVMPPRMRFPERDDLWVPFRPGGEPPRTQRGLAAFGAVKATTTVAQVQQELDVLASRLAAQHPDTNRDWGIRAIAFRDSAVNRGTRVLLATLLGAVMAVLLIGCANLANLAMARGVARQREMAVRSALGATRGRLVRQMLAEGALLSLVGSALGLAVALSGMKLIAVSWPEELPYWVTIDLDWHVVAFTATLATLAALACGVPPALRSSRPDPIGELRHGTRASPSSGQHRLQAALVVCQVAVCLALLVGANLMIRSFLKLATADSGFAEDQLLTLRFYIAGDQYDQLEMRTELVRSLVERLESLPGVAHAAVTSSIPTVDGGAPIRFLIDGDPVPAGQEPGAQMIAASPSLFETLGLALVEGRTFSAAEHASPESRVAIVNSRLAKRFGPQGAVGSRIGFVDGNETRWLRIVGVAPDIQYGQFDEETPQSRLSVFVPYALAPSRSMALLLRARTAPAAQGEVARRVLRELDPGLPSWQIRTMADVRALTTWEQRFFGRMMGGFAGVAMLVACLGVYGILAHAVSRRTHEIGVRLALGARPLDVTRLVMGRGLSMATAGVVVGSLLSFIEGRFLQGILYGISGSDVTAVAAMGGLLTVVVLFASWLPARRAAAVDPMVVLRNQ